MNLTRMREEVREEMEEEWMREAEEREKRGERAENRKEKRGGEEGDLLPKRVQISAERGCSLACWVKTGRR